MINNVRLLYALGGAPKDVVVWVHQSIADSLGGHTTGVQLFPNSHGIAAIYNHVKSCLHLVYKGPGQTVVPSSALQRCNLSNVQILSCRMSQTKSLHFGSAQVFQWSKVMATWCIQEIALCMLT